MQQNSSEEELWTRDTDAGQLLRYAEELGRLHHLRQADRQQMEAMEQALAASQAQQLAIIEDFKRSYETETAARHDLQEAYLATIRVLSAAVETRDDYTGGHVERVRGYCLILAKDLGLSEESIRSLDMGALLHDVGKIGVPDAVLRKPGPLDADEWVLIKTHPIVGAKLIAEVPFLASALPVVVSHHERWDGTGYPHGLRGEAIPVVGRVAAVADAFDALTTDRIYRKKRDVTAAMEELARCSGSQFDPAVVDALDKALKNQALDQMLVLSGIPLNTPFGAAE